MAKQPMLLNNTHLTFDVDWASDGEIDFVLNKLINHEIKSTWFMTHKTDLIHKMKRYPHLFEIGIHPNFGIGSTQVNFIKRKLNKLLKRPPSIYSVMNHLTKLYPEVKSFRTHAMHYSHYISEILATQYNMKIDSSVCMNEMKNITPFKSVYGDKEIISLYYFWSDDTEISKKYPCFSIRNRYHWFENKGLKILCFHPTHIYHNSPSINWYRNMKFPNENYQGRGIYSFFLDIIEDKHAKKFKKLSTLPDYDRL